MLPKKGRSGMATPGAKGAVMVALSRGMIFTRE